MTCTAQSWRGHTINQILRDGQCWQNMKAVDSFKIYIGAYNSKGLRFLQHIRENIVDIPLPKKATPPKEVREELNSGSYDKMDLTKGVISAKKCAQRVDCYTVSYGKRSDFRQKNDSPFPDGNYVIGCLIRFAATESFYAYQSKHCVPDQYFKYIKIGFKPETALLKCIAGIPTFSFAPIRYSGSLLIKEDTLKKAFKSDWVLQNLVISYRKRSDASGRQVTGIVEAIYPTKTIKKGKKILLRKNKNYFIEKFFKDGSVMVKNELGKRQKVKEHVKNRY
tara:strand:- start:1174 stop:2010 length:837 start_codon:yes stop_codon:yes gene_type:complete